jgi:signal transduction histidine kinase
LSDRPRSLSPRHLLPRSLGTRTALILLAGLAIVQGIGLTVHTMGRIDLERLQQAETLGLRFSSIYRSVVLAAPEQREAALRELDPKSGFAASLDQAPATSDLEPTPSDFQRLIRISMQVSPMPQGLRWRELLIRGVPREGRMLISLRLPSGEWLNERVRVPLFGEFWSRTFLIAWLGMTAAAAVLVFWAVNQFAAPMRRLAAAAEQLGVDVNAAPLPEEGSSETLAAAVAFNTMAARIRRFVHDRTFMLTAIGHDLRTPITRLKLRAEWMEDEEQQRKMLADLDELEGMVAATLAFGRADANAEAPAAIDLAELLRTILEEAQDARPDMADKCVYEGPAHLTVRARPVAMKRALTNLVLNALNYGGNVTACVTPPRDSVVTVQMEDDGPGIPAGDLERVFEPFQRLEDSRNRETGGTGLGLPIARNILRAHGGDVVLANRAKGGLKAIVTLPG